MKSMVPNRLSRLRTFVGRSVHLVIVSKNSLRKKLLTFEPAPARSGCAIKTTSSSFLVPRVKWPNPSFVHDSPIRSNPTFERRLSARFNGNAELLLHPPRRAPELSDRPEPPAR